MPRALLLVNPKSRSGDGGAEGAIRALRAGGMELVEPNVASGDLSRTIREHRDQCDLVILGGGDGTMSAAASALIDTRLPLGILPLGTGNDLARTLGVSFDPIEAARVILGGRQRDIDVGEVNGRPFFNVASLGLSVTVAHRLDPVVKRRYGRFGYVITAARVMATARPFSVEIDDGETLVRARTYQVAVGNGRYYGGGNAIHHAAEIDDGLLHLYSLEMKSLWKLAALGPFFRTGRFAVFKEVRTIHSDNFEIRTHVPRSINADGEIIGKTPARFRLLRDAVRVFVPDEARSFSLLQRFTSGVER